MPRKRKKAVKKQTVYRFWMGMVGSILALGNAALAVPIFGLSSATAIASMTAGCSLLAAAGFNRPELFRKREIEREMSRES